MKIKSGFILHTVGGEYVVVPVGARTKEFKGMVRLNGSGAFLWEQMQTEFTREAVVAALLEKYEVTEEVAVAAVNQFISTLREGNLLDD